MELSANNNTENKLDRSNFEVKEDKQSDGKVLVDSSKKRLDFKKSGIIYFLIFIIIGVLL